MMSTFLHSVSAADCRSADVEMPAVSTVMAAKKKAFEKKSSISASIEITSPVAKVVLMPGDPLRAKYVADHYLKDVKCFNKVRNMP